MHELIASPLLGGFYLARPGQRNGARIPRQYFEELSGKGDADCPEWLVDTARRAWGLDLAGRSVSSAVLVREPSVLAYAQASYELNLGCNWACKHCYLGLKEFSGLDWDNRERLLAILRDAGVLYLQLTGGEPMVDRLFPAVYTRAFDLGMLLEIKTNGSRLHNPLLLELITVRRPHRITLSVYGASEPVFDGLTQRRGAYRDFRRGMDAALEAGLPVELSLIITKETAREADAMRGLAAEHGLAFREFSQMSPTIHGGAETLASQTTSPARQRKPFTGCDAGHTSLHVDPHGAASVCKVARNPAIDLLREGIEGLAALGGIADGLLKRQGGCTGCTLSSSCSTCMPLAALYRQANAPRSMFCQHP